MNYEIVFRLAEPYLRKNEFGITHTRRVYNIAKNIFDIPKDIEELIFYSIIMHDIGGSSIKNQYEKGPKITESILKKLECDENFIDQVCKIIRTHHNHPDSPILAFKILYDSDKLVMFSKEEFSYYDSQSDFNWNKIIDLLYHNHSRQLAKELLQKRRSQKA